MATLKGMFGALGAVVACLVVAIFAATIFSGEDRRRDVGRALGLGESAKFETSAVNDALRARFPDGVAATSLDRFISDLHGSCHDVSEAQWEGCAPNATALRCRALHGAVHNCEVQVRSAFCIGTFLWTSARRQADGTLSNLRATVGRVAC